MNLDPPKIGMSLQAGPPAGKLGDGGREDKKINYTVYVRLPINRPANFMDPPDLDWDEAKSDALWNVVSNASKTEINWHELAQTFGVPVQFLLTMVQYLQDQHNDRLKVLLRRATVSSNKSCNTSSLAPSADPIHPPPTPSSDGLRRTGSLSGKPSAISSVRGDSPLPKSEQQHTVGSPRQMPTRPGVTRNEPSDTTVLSAGGKNSPAAIEGSVFGQRRRLSSLPIASPPTAVVEEYKHEHERDEILVHHTPRSAVQPAHAAEVATNMSAFASVSAEASPDAESSPGPAESSSDDDDDSSSLDGPVQSRIFRRPPNFHGGGAVDRNRATDDADDDDDDEAEPAFMPFKSASSDSGAGQDLGATIRGDLRGFPPGRQVSGSSNSHQAGAGPGRHGVGSGAKSRIYQSQTSDSSAGSAAALGSRPRHPGLLSSHRAAEPASSRSPTGRGNEGTLSMGSSFSDLENASVTQSDLEEALASRMQLGGAFSSRMSTFSQAIRSRYLPNPNQSSASSNSTSAAQNASKKK